MKGYSNALAQASVHIGGMGRIGTHIALALHAAGVGEISCNDPQDFEEEQLPVTVYARRSDIGRPKVNVLERFLDGRPNLNFTAIAKRNESPKVRPYLEKADMIVSCANDLVARLYMERMAMKLGKPCVQVSVSDARTALVGAITAWRPGANCSCFGCLFPDGRHAFPRGEILPPILTGITAALAASIIVDLLATDKAIDGERKNVFFVDLRNCSLEAITIVPRPTCKICGPDSLQF